MRRREDKKTREEDQKRRREEEKKRRREEDKKTRRQGLGLLLNSREKRILTFYFIILLFLC